MSEKAPAILALEDGTIFRGRSAGARGERLGELVFNTALSGYQEILTDPSYKGQMVVMTNPLIGNYGINPQDMESRGTFLEGFIMRECSRMPSNFRSARSLPDYLDEQGVVAIEGIDTRALTKKIRDGGAMKAVLSTEEKSADALVDKAKKFPGLNGADLASQVSCGEPYEWKEGFSHFLPPAPEMPTERYAIVAYDFGIKRNILRSLHVSGFQVTVVPAKTSAEEVLRRKPAGVFLSNGPGDPEPLKFAFQNVKALAGKVPIMGICLGHQILGQAFGYSTYKMKFGHHGGNQPVKDLATGKVEITSQNHSFAVDLKGRNAEALEITHVNLNDQTNEGMRHKDLPIFSVQYHPEACPGPHDSTYLFARFREMIERFHR